jgi:uncharacterized membrane protein YbaN (DUF454 family)
VTAQIHSSRALRVVFLVLGWLCLALGVVGLFLPVMPGTVFILLAAFFFARSSQRVHDSIIRHPRLGPLVEDYQAGRGIPRPAKVLAVTMIIASFALSMVVFVKSLGGRTAMAATAAAIIWYIATRPTKEPALP